MIVILMLFIILVWSVKLILMHSFFDYIIKYLIVNLFLTAGSTLQLQLAYLIQVLFWIFNHLLSYIHLLVFIWH